MTRATVSRQLWSSLRTWRRKPQVVVPGRNRRSRYWTPCSWRASRMLRSLKESAKGNPWSRAKRARTSWRVVMVGSQRSWAGMARTQKAPRRNQVRTKGARVGNASHLHCTRHSLAALVVCDLTRGPRPCLPLSLRHSTDTPPSDTSAVHDVDLLCGRGQAAEILQGLHGAREEEMPPPKSPACW